MCLIYSIVMWFVKFYFYYFMRMQIEKCMVFEYIFTPRITILTAYCVIHIHNGVSRYHNILMQR